MNRRIGYLGGVVLCLLLAAVLRLHNLDEQSLWFDEGWSAYAATQASVWQAANADATNPPLYYILLFIHAWLTGHHIFVLRWLSFGFGMLSVALTTRLTVHITKRKNAALPALLLATVNMPLIWAAQEMRMYTLLAVLVAIMAIAWEQLRTRPTRTAWSLLLLAQLATLYTHNTGPVIVLWLNSVTLLAWLSGRKPPLGAWIMGQVAVGVLWLPYFVTRFVTVAGANNALVRRSPFDFNLWGALWLAPWEALLDNTIMALWTIPILLAVIACAPWHKAAVRWLAVHIIVLIAGLYMALAVLGNELHGRYFVMLVPLAVAITAAAWIHVGNTKGWLRWGVRATTLVALLLPSIIGWRLLRHPAYQHDDVAGMVRHYSETLSAEDSVIAWSYADRYDLAYYWEQWDIGIDRVTLPEGADFAEVLPLLPNGGDVSLNVWYTQRADYRGMMSCVLGHGTSNPPAFHEVSGMATLTYREPVLQPPRTQPSTAQFTVATIERVPQLPTDFTANQAVCLPVTITLQQPTSGELKAAVIAVNALGQEIARADAVFATANQRTSVDNTIGEQLTAYPVLRLPYGAPPSDYELRLRLYDDGALSGYDVLADGSAVGKDWRWGAWEPISGAEWVIENGADQLSLVRRESSATDVRNGDRVLLTLLWEGVADEQLPTLTLRGENWSVDVPPSITAYDNVVLDWRTFQIPLDATDGEAVLTQPNGQVIERYVIREIPLQMEPPPLPYSADVRFSQIGTVIGYEVEIADDELQVTLVWRVDDSLAIDRDYTVFVQMIADGAQVIAQSDTQPAAGTRPTTGWRSGEIIVDQHRLSLPPDVDLTDTDLIFGLYDSTGTRVNLPDGGTYAVLPHDENAAD